MQEITCKKPAAGQTLRQLAQLYKGRWGQLICAVFWFVIKHSPVFITPVIIANIINIVTAPSRMSSSGSDGKKALPTKMHRNT